MNTERDLFEAWARNEKLNLERFADFPDTYRFSVVRGAWIGWQARAAMAEQAPAEPALKERLTDAIAQALAGTYHCTRVWSAWVVGTMSEDDFSPVDESDTPAEIADIVLATLAAATPPKVEKPALPEPVLLTLPEHDAGIIGTNGEFKAYSGKLVQSYAKACVEADRAQRGGA